MRSPDAVHAPPSHATLRPAAGPSPRALLGVFTAAIFLSAFLLFLVQPLYSKMVLPMLGGTPAVWNTCMLFFQTTLLAGYLYAHASARWLSLPRQAMLHAAVLAAAALSLPISVSGAVPGGSEPPIPWLLLLMAGTVGLPFFALSGTGPLLQRWFSQTRHPDAANPYFLYAASNLGSLLALLGYPVLVEPTLRLAEQSWGWTAGYAGLWLLVGACAVGAHRAPGDGAVEAARAGGEVTLRDRVRWIVLALVPSALMLSVTTFITTDLAPVPLLWVVPLALYLLTFILAFARRPVVPGPRLLTVQLLLIVGVVLEMSFHLLRTLPRTLPLHLAAFAVTAMVCHGELARRRPPARHLTEFYLWLSFGGMLGGVFNVLVAPRLFPRMEEYALLLALACLVRPRPAAPPARSDGQLALAVGGVATLLLMANPGWVPLPPAWTRYGLALAVTVVCLGMARRRARLALCVAAVLGLGILQQYRDPDALLTRRSFFGQHSVKRVSLLGGMHLLYHGTTLHGAQRMRAAERRQALTYYSAGGPVGQLFAALPARPGRRVGIIGLGAGSSAAYAGPGEAWTFYEIDPGVAATAQDPRYFTFLEDSPARHRVVLGDARLSLRHAPPGAFDLIMVDAFSSASIPVHLLTREALDLYLAKLAPGGTVVLHLSNRYLDLEPVVERLAADRGLVMRVGRTTDPPQLLTLGSTWAVLAREPSHLGALATDARWDEPRRRVGVGVWTDDFSNLLTAFGRSR